MTRPVYGELHDHEFKQQVGDYELWIARVQYPNRPLQYAYNLRRGGSVSNDDPFNTEAEAIAKGIEQGNKMTAENQARARAMLLTGNADAKVWAQEFAQTVKELDGIELAEDWLEVWFANAIMAGYDFAERQQREIAHSS